MNYQCLYVDEVGDQCLLEAEEGFPCCGKYHGFLFKEWLLVKNNWETCFDANSEIKNKINGYINQTPVRNISIATYQYYEQSN